jgi:glutathione S-transferase
VDLKNKPDWFLERNPLGAVPVLEQDDKIVYESLITCDYLDAVYPSNRLTPTDPYRKARDAMLTDYYGSKVRKICKL